MGNHRAAKLTGLAAALTLLAAALTLEACAHEPDAVTEAPTLEPAAAAVTGQVAELAASWTRPDLERLAHELALAEPVAVAAKQSAPPPRPTSPARVAEQLAAAEALLAEIAPRARPRTSLRGPRPAAAADALERAYAEGRAVVVEGRLDQVREWMALAKFGHAEPGPVCERSPLARYDLVVTRKPESATAYLHVIVPASGLPGPGGIGRHEAFIGDERWVNLADVIAPQRDYLPFKTNGRESLHRQWARAEVVTELARIAGEYQQRTGVPLGIGDLSHVTGGKIEDHWTHQQGVDVDLYLLDPREADGAGRPRVWWNHVKRGVSLWTANQQGKGEREPALDPGDPLSHTPTSLRLQILAQIVFVIDEVAYFVHNDTRTLAPFDEQVGERRPGRRFLHAKNRGYWPTHADHVHLRWVDGELPVGKTPRP